MIELFCHFQQIAIPRSGLTQADYVFTEKDYMNHILIQLEDKPSTHKTLSDKVQFAVESYCFDFAKYNENVMVVNALGFFATGSDN